MKSDDFVKYLTIRFVEYIDNPKQKKFKKVNKEPISFQWFGVIPFSIKLFIKRFQKNA